jgi:hypothetical protein
MAAKRALGLFVTALLVSDLAAAQDRPDFSGSWVLDSAAQPSADIPKTLIVRQSLAHTNVRGEPMKPFYRTLAVTREFESGLRSEAYLIGVSSATFTLSGRAGLPRSHHGVRWEDKTLVIESGTYTGATPQTGEWTERREQWSISLTDRLQLSIINSSSRNGSSTVTLTYRRQ